MSYVINEDRRGRWLSALFHSHGNTVIVLLCGGDKSTQNKGIDRAIELAKFWKD